MTARKTVLMAGPTPSYVGAGVLLTRYVTYDVAAAQVAADTIDFFRLPAGAVPVGGYIATVGVDALLDFDLGIVSDEDNSVIDADYFLASQTGVADAEFYGPFPTQPQLLQETIVQGTINVGGAAQGTITVRVDYHLPFFAAS